MGCCAKGGERVRWRRLALLVLACVVLAAAGTVLAVAVNVATGGTAQWFPALQRHPRWWTAGATAAVTAGSLLVWGAQRWYDRGLSVLVPAVQRREPWVVDRPAEVGQVVAALRRRAGTVGNHHGGALGGRVRQDDGGEDGAGGPAGVAPVRGQGVLGDAGPDVGRQALPGWSTM